MTSLLKKYDIPINHLDFDYIKSCEDVKEIERIVTILKSGEEGYYPDLTNCALVKLKALKPNSKVLREEAPVLNKRSMNNEEWNHITTSIDDWTESMKKNSEILREETSVDQTSDVFPIRQFSEKDSSEKESTKTNIKRIKSCDYAQWDKYDPEVEMLKMDINEEQQQCETVKVKNIKNCTSIDSAKTQQLADKLSTIEKVDLANKHRIKGNEFYKAADYDEAIREYSLSIQIYHTASAFNNRAITYFKLNNLDMTIADCEQCLRLEPNNVKALQRKAQALSSQSRYREAYDDCTKILSIESNNEWARNKLIEIKPKIPDLPPANAFRMKIVEDEEDPENPPIDLTKYNFADLIIPNKIYPSKLSKLKSSFVLNKNGNSKKKSDPVMKSKEHKNNAGLIMPTRNSQSKSKITEYRNGVVIEEL
ncbi:sperm-associated antigen 1 [Bradysia coprophila]|uniref:sperm-associated antigen 1 n=1 Tax=Bradysia coprophila TaxID=38358 RepID=UPI00187D8944|nr:sperm-associated antigen 1 [Bradysia coprophila]